MSPDLRNTLVTLLPRMRRFGLALTGSAADADDLVQLTCERVILRSAQLREHARLDAWLYGIMRNLWIDELRYRKRRQHDDLDTATGVIGDDGQAVVDGRITLAAVRLAMQDMPADQRILLMLVCVDGLTYREASETLGIPLGTVMSRLSRARQDLHQRMNPAPKPDGVAQFPLRGGAGRDKRPGETR